MTLTSQPFFLPIPDPHSATCKQLIFPVADLLATHVIGTCRDGGIHRDHLVAKDSSGNGNDLPLVTPPLRQDVTISQVSTHWWT